MEIVASLRTIFGVAQRTPDDESGARWVLVNVLTRQESGYWIDQDKDSARASAFVLV
jgi:hypothetical protein